MNEISVFLKESGSIAELYKDFALYTGCYRNVQITIYVPQSILYNVSGVTAAVKTGAILTAPNGDRITTQSYYAGQVKLETVGDAEYAVFTQIMPKEYALYAGTQQLVLNVVTIDNNEDPPVINTITTSQTAQLVVLQSAYLDEDEAVDPSQTAVIEGQINALSGRVSQNESDIASLHVDVDAANQAAQDAQEAAQRAQSAAETAAQDAAEETAAKVQDALQESVTQAQDAATAAQGSANDALEAAQEAKDAALTIGQSAGKQVHFVTSTADMTQEGELYAMVTDSDANLFALYIVQNGTPVYSGSANIVVPTMDYFFATLSPAGWSANRQTVSLQDATPTSETTVIPVDTDAVEYVLCGVRATSVSSGSMTFACDSVPQNNITVIIGVFTEVDLPNASDYYTSAQVDEKISTVDSKITAETSAREAADEQLRQSIAGFQGSISAETTARQQADQQLQSSIDAVSQDLTEETSARQSADGTLQQSITALQTELSNETQQRQSADNTFTQNISSLQTSLSTETQQRQSADSAMQQDISQLQSDVQGILEDAATKEHFRGYYNTTAEIQSIPNPADGDYAWNAQTGTVWNYTTAWADSNVPVPDKTVEKSSAAPLMDGTASAGSSNQYAAGDHRHPTDTTRAAAADLSAEIAAREQGDTALQTAVGNVQSALTTETQQRQAADTQINGDISDLQTGLSTETQNRTNADTTLQNNINSEASARQQADNALSARIDDIEDGTTGIGTAQKVQNALTLTVNGETTVFDGSAARSVAIDCVQYVDVSIDTSRWSGTSATLTSSDFAKLSYVTASNLVQFVPSDGSAAMIWDSEVALSAQAAGSITFTCTSTPSAAVSGTVIIYN